jgi:integrase
MFREAVQRYQTEIQSNVSMKKTSKDYLLKQCLRKIELSWPDLWTHKIENITEDKCREWAARLNKEISSQYFNNTIIVLKRILEIGIAEQVRRGGNEIPNPARILTRARVSQRPPELPEPDQFRRMVKSIRMRSGGWGHRAADLIEFLAYSGMRLRTESLWVTWEDVDWSRNEIVVRGDPETHTKNWEIRRIPILPNMETLLRKLQANRGGSPTGRILQVARCHESLKRACEEIGIPRMSHHDLRHLFATRCIEAGVDIPTVARWLGHKDGGALAMKTYGHLRNEHSQQMALKVQF